MLYLEPPFYMINGVTVFRDHQDPLFYYYMPASPRLRVINDAQTGKPVPQISLIKYKSAVTGNGGFLNFDVHLGLTEDELDDIASEIMRLARLSRKPSLMPVPVSDGSVRMMLFGQESAPPPPPPGSAASPPVTTSPKFVLKMQHAAKPSLYGDNAAAFSVQLDQYGAAVMEKAIRGEMSPIVIAYSLDYAALRPAFSVRLKIDWDRVQDHLDQSFGQEGLFTSIQISDAVDKLRDDRAIIFEADNFVPDAGDAGKSNAERFDAARARVQEMITDSFFEPSLSPDKPQTDGWDKATKVLNDINRISQQAALASATGGVSAIIGTFSFKKNNYKRVDRKRLDVEVSERSAVLRTIHPQGHVSGLFSALQSGFDPARFIKEVDADDPWFDRRRVRIVNLGNAAQDEHQSVHVMLDYGGDRKDVLLNPQKSEDALEWASIMERGAVKQEIETEYTVHLKPDPSGERPNFLRSKKRVMKDDILQIQPADIYAQIKVPVIASPSFPWDRFPQVQVFLRYHDADNGIRIEDAVRLDKAASAAEWKFLAVDKLRRAFEQRISFRAANGADVDTGWVPSDRELVDIRDPFATQRLRVEVFPAMPRWEDVEQIFVDLEYDDPANNFRETASLTFSPADRATKPFIVDLRNKDLRTVSFSVTMVMKGGVIIEVPRSTTEQARIFIRPDMKGRRIVSVRPPKDFAKDKLEKVSVELRYEDDAAGISIADKAVFEKSGGRKVFEFDYVDPTRLRYKWRADFLFANGMTASRDWQESDTSELSIATP